MAKAVLVLIALAMVGAIANHQFTALAADDKYTTKYDNINLDEILNNDRLYQSYYKCLAGDNKCTPDAAELKKILPDALQTGCSKCNEKQRQGAEKVIKFLLDKKPSDYAVLEKKYDPSGNYKAKYQAEAKKIGIPV